MDDAAAGANKVVADSIQWPLTALDRMSAVLALVQGEMQGRPMYDSTLMRDAWAATSASARLEVLPHWHDVTQQDIGFLRARFGRLQAHVAATDTAIMLLFCQRHWAPHASATLRHLVNHGFPDLEELVYIVWLCLLIYLDRS